MRKAIIGVSPKTKRCELLAVDTPENRSEAEAEGLIIVPTTIENARRAPFGEKVEDIYSLGSGEEA